MKTILSTFILSTLVLARLCLAMPHEADSEKAKSLQKEIEHSLVAPCCWNMTVDQHDSQAARQVRTKISELIEQGKTKDEILAYFVAQPQYGERILAAPSQNTLLGKMAYWLIPIAIIFGAFVAAKTIKSLSKKETSGASPLAQKETKNELPSDDKWGKKVEDELSQLDL